jgi:hypothetical protein
MISSFSVRFKCPHHLSDRPGLSGWQRFIGPSDRPDGRYADPLDQAGDVTNVPVSAGWALTRLTTLPFRLALGENADPLS